MCMCWEQAGSGRSWLPLERHRSPKHPHVRLQTPVPLLLLPCAGGSAAALSSSPHTSGPQEAGGGAVCSSPPPSPALKVNLCSCGALAAGRLSASQMERHTGGSPPFPACLWQASSPHPQVSRWSCARRLGRSVRAAARLCAGLPHAWPVGPQPCPASRTELLFAAVLGARGNCRAPEPAMPGCLCPVPAHASGRWWGLRAADGSLML